MVTPTKISRTSVLRAIREFDKNLRTAPEWRDWEGKRNHQYALRHAGRLYPVKKILSLAAGKHVNEFYGGRYPGHANGLIEGTGFDVVRLRGGNPDWSQDELIVALDFYLRHRTKLPSKDDKSLIELSASLRRLGAAVFPGEMFDDTFRNPNGVYAKLMNLRNIDPEYTSKGGIGLTHGGKRDREVWAEFGDHPAKCAEVAKAILACLSNESRYSPSGEEVEDIVESQEGRMLSRLHRSRERDPRLAKKKRAFVLNATGRLQCEVCGFDFALVYPGRGDGFIECHHVQPLAALPSARTTRLEDLALLCSNCHRMIHRTREWYSLQRLKELLSDVKPIGMKKNA